MGRGFKITVAAVVILLAIGAGASYYIRSRPAPEQAANNQSGQGSPSSLSPQSSSLSLTYTHPEYGFSFEYPETATVSSREEGEGEMVTLQLAGKGVVAQVYISAFTGKEITRQMVQSAVGQDLANDKFLAVDGAQGISFEAKGGESPATTEAWFHKDGRLYQTAALSEDGQSLKQIIESWKFNE